eukprot:gene18877-25435_t
MKFQFKKLVKFPPGCLFPNELKKSCPELELQSEADSPLTADSPRDKEVLPQPEQQSVKEQLLVLQALHIELKSKAADHEALAEKLQLHLDRQSVHHFVEDCFLKVVCTSQKLEPEVAQAVADVKQLQDVKTEEQGELKETLAKQFETIKRIEGKKSILIKAVMTAANSTERQIKPEVMSIMSSATPSSLDWGSGSAMTTLQSQGSVPNEKLEDTVAVPAASVVMHDACCQTTFEVQADEDLEMHAKVAASMVMNDAGCQTGSEVQADEDFEMHATVAGSVVMHNAGCQTGSEVKADEDLEMHAKVAATEIKQLLERTRVMAMTIQELKEGRAKDGEKMKERQKKIQQLHEDRVEEAEKIKPLQKNIWKLEKDYAAQGRLTIQLLDAWGAKTLKQEEVEATFAKAAVKMHHIQESNDAGEAAIQKLLRSVQMAMRRWQSAENKERDNRIMETELEFRNAKDAMADFVMSCPTVAAEIEGQGLFCQTDFEVKVEAAFIVSHSANKKSA